jgi:hypothetical protein
MQRAILGTVAIAVITGAYLPAARAADLHRPTLQRSVGHGGWHQRYGYVGCTTSYYCYPLYGAYGPYGGTSYWGAFTEGGWGYRHW